VSVCDVGGAGAGVTAVRMVFVMVLPNRTGAPVAYSRTSFPTSQVRTPRATSVTRSDLRSGPTRSFEIAALRRDGSRYLGQVKLPALPVFEQAFSAFARGTVLQADVGEIAIEDLIPGDKLWTRDGAAARVLWIGSGTFSPQEARGRRMPLVRIMADSFGACRPNRFVTLGSGARILQTPPHLRNGSKPEALLSPVREFVDTVNVIEVIPPTPVHLFHVVLERHSIIRAGGLEVETYHPGSQTLRGLSRADLQDFMKAFPQFDHPTDFGPLCQSRAPDDASSMIR